jgi:hypothetical protein
VFAHGAQRKRAIDKYSRAQRVARTEKTSMAAAQCAHRLHADIVLASDQETDLMPVHKLMVRCEQRCMVGHFRPERSRVCAGNYIFLAKLPDFYLGERPLESFAAGYRIFGNSHVRSRVAADLVY